MRYMSLLMRLSVVMLPLFFTAAASAHSTLACDAVFRAENAGPLLRPFLQRIWGDKDQTDSVFLRPRTRRYMRIIEKSLKRPSLPSFADGRVRGAISIEPEDGTRDLEVSGGFSVQQDGTLNIHFVSVTVLARSEFGRGADSAADYGLRPKGASLMMVDLVAAVLGSARSYAHEHKEIKSVLIRAQSLRNPSLVKMLIDSGFEPAPVESNLANSYMLRLNL